MINEYTAKKYCSEDISIIENYELAVNDTTQTWDCHHRGEILPCGRFSIDDLKKFGLYYKRPASELIFLTKAEHTRLHNICVPLSEATKKAIGEALKGIPKSEDHKKAISDAKKGVPLSEANKQAISDALKGIPKSEAHKKAMSEALSGVPKGPMSEDHKKAISDALKGIPKSEAHKKAIAEAQSKKIMQLTKSGEFIREWQSAREAERELGIAQTNICKCCNGIRKSAGGYVWRYA